jgi:hypothetical protein
MWDWQSLLMPLWSQEIPGPLHGPMKPPVMTMTGGLAECVTHFGLFVFSMTDAAA